MSVSIILARNPCVILQDGTPSDECRASQSVSDPLISSDAVGLARAEAILDRHGSQWQVAQLSCPADLNMVPGALVDVIDSETGPVRGKLERIRYTVKISDDGKSFTADAELTIRRLL